MFIHQHTGSEKKIYKGMNTGKTQNTHKCIYGIFIHSLQKKHDDQLYGIATLFI